MLRYAAADVPAPRQSPLPPLSVVSALLPTLITLAHARAQGHVFADLWHFDAEALLYDTAAFRDCWQVDWAGQPDLAAPQQQHQQQQPARDADGVVARDEAGARSPLRLPASTRQLAMERLGADTYVPLYGGSELLFACGLREPQAAGATG